MSGGVTDTQATSFSVLGSTTADIETDINSYIDALLTNDPFSFWVDVFAGTLSHRLSLRLKLLFHLNDGAGNQQKFDFYMSVEDTFAGETDLSKFKNQVGAFIGGIEAILLWSTFDTIEKITGRGQLYVEYLP